MSQTLKIWPSVPSGVEISAKHFWNADTSGFMENPSGRVNRGNALLWQPGVKFWQCTIALDDIKCHILATKTCASFYSCIILSSTVWYKRKSWRMLFVIPYYHKISIFAALRSSDVVTLPRPPRPASSAIFESIGFIDSAIGYYCNFKILPFCNRIMRGGVETIYIFGFLEVVDLLPTSKQGRIN